MSPVKSPMTQISSLLATLGSSAALAPKAWPKRFIVLAFIFMAVTILLFSSHPQVPAVVRDISSNVPTFTGFSHSDTTTVHPVDRLHTEWVSKFNKKVEGQSRTLEEAIKKYKQKYHREPPVGFDIWYDYAVENDYIMIDEFDTLMETIEPYWKVDPQEIRTRVELSDGDGSLTQISVRDGNATCEWRDNTHVIQAAEWINKFNTTKLLPLEFNFTINTLDEPRVNAAIQEYDPLTMTKHVVPPLKLGQETPYNPEPNAPRKRLDWTTLTHKHVWPVLSQSCPEDQQPIGQGYESTTLPFLNEQPSRQDFCESVGMLDEHGFFQFPATLYMTQSLVPIFSQAAPTRFNDFLYPSPYYIGSARDKGNPHEPDWNLKFSVLYWAGSSTGGYHTSEHWMDIQRAGLAARVLASNKMPVTLLRRTGKFLEPFKSTWTKISHYFHIHITNLVQCEEKACAEMKEVFGDVKGEPSSMAEQYKYVLDIDGNSFSGRFYRLLKSKSAIVKSTIFREWHDDLLYPWVHFIPLSTSANEAGEMMRYFATDMRGDEIGKEIADAGREWANKVLREVDLEIYFLRMMMEYGRLLSDDRDSEETSFILGRGKSRPGGHTHGHTHGHNIGDK